MFSANIQQWNNDYFECRWGVRDFRQGAITIGREFIAPDDSYDHADSVLAESADHSIGIDHSQYAMVHGLVPRLSFSVICKHRWMGDQWHSVLGLGPYPPPEAIRIRRQSIVHGTNLQSMSDVVKNTTDSVLKHFFSGKYAEIVTDTVSTAFIQQRNDVQAGGSTGLMPLSRLAGSWNTHSLTGHRDCERMQQDDSGCEHTY
jgi:hypothetical protein